MSLHLSLITAASKYKQHQTKAKKIRIENFDKLLVVPSNAGKKTTAMKEKTLGKITWHKMKEKNNRNEGTK